MGSKRIIQSLFLGAALIGIAYWQLSSSGHQPAQASAAAKTIQDPLIIEGLNHLSKQTDPIHLPDGDSLSGAALAQFIIDSHIPVIWGSDDICGGGSCSLMYCSADGDCSYEDGQPGIDPIFINASIQEQGSGMLDRLASELAHEAFHRMRYFGNAKISLLEEYWAFYISAQITENSWLKFDNIDTQDPEQLQRWFYLNGMQSYLHLPAYPGSADPDSSPQVSQALPARAGE